MKKIKVENKMGSRSLLNHIHQRRNSSRTLVIAATLLILSTTLSGAGNAAGNAMDATATGWKQITNRTACEAMNPRHCAGSYGLEVSEYGHFIIGPNADGKTLEGELTLAEFTRLKVHADAVTSNIAVDPDGKCTSGRHVTGMSDIINIIIGSKTYPIIDQLNAQCSYHSDFESTKHLIENIRQIRQKYYITPF
ncbi:hypothetical protein AAKU61_004480 [Undibacterium sp. GrIS 1.2]|uniref:hypothetical protein n=1 Tax=Undibacterium sp. GrIS 1.2 TaxID=3143933 RepID=UPI003394D8DF